MKKLIRMLAFLMIAGVMFSGCGNSTGANQGGDASGNQNNNGSNSNQYRVSLDEQFKWKLEITSTYETTDKDLGAEVSNKKVDVSELTISDGNITYVSGSLQESSIYEFPEGTETQIINALIQNIGDKQTAWQQECEQAGKTIGWMVNWAEGNTVTDDVKATKSDAEIAAMNVKGQTLSKFNDLIPEDAVIEKIELNYKITFTQKGKTEQDPDCNIVYYIQAHD